jgi:hypothetical protein
MQCILSKIILENIFIYTVNSTCILYTFMNWQDFILAKSGCYNDKSNSDDKHMPQESMNTNF